MWLSGCVSLIPWLRDTCQPHMKRTEHNIRPITDGSTVQQHSMFDAESDPEPEEAPAEVQTLRLQRDISKWLATLLNFYLFF